ncbi:hypothetical protein HELRODRAFT_76698 [Helobdella robusta]|uniref:Dehydrogenase/reductase SDR family member 11 n=1 Tax=Helobdella robusta TaxID=6412 RepID=T1G2M7_HELRO|nr:hypothetical protein HELRODRAFT_76698 [Helobdella robusta]ESO07102.1 hypothetical protein HELRODRAFT_76698 [Helobdella robusta]
MEKWHDRVALVTGASSGIGWAVASKLASCGVKVIACARNYEKLQELEQLGHPNQITPIKCDLTSEEEILAMFERISKDHGGVDICINNAGLTHSAPLLSSKTENWKDILDVNVLALCICTRESIKQMKKRKIDDGFIINICSMAGHRMLKSPNNHFYMATKQMVKALTEGVHNELRAMKSNIRVTQISPAVTETEFFVRGLGSKVAEQIFKANPPLQANNIADAVIYALTQPPHVQICDILIKPTCSDN